jgi:hypothetical protein
MVSRFRESEIPQSFMMSVVEVRKRHHECSIIKVRQMLAVHL